MMFLWISWSLAGQNADAAAEYARQVTTANLRAAQLEEQLVSAKTRIDQLEEFVRVEGRTQAAKLENLDQVNTEVTRLRGEIEVLTHGLEQLRTDFENQLVSQERRQLHDESRLRQLEDFLGVKAPPPPTDAEMGLVAGGGTPSPLNPDNPVFDPANPAPTMEPVVPDTARGVLDAAVAHMAEGRQGVARALLDKAKTTYASSPELSEISYRLAETHLNEKAYGKAALAFKGVIDNHPTSEWAPWAMLRQGECFAGLNQATNARLFYDGVVQRYPKSEAAKEAKKKLAE